ncbi:MAG: hypothetical protein IPM48_00270 [Saprospiraceae bacterium]|nr:hypothetical protein [Saprospiraceae bacterium]
MPGVIFSAFNKDKDLRSVFEKLLEIFLEILVHTSGDVEEAFDWLEQIDREHRITTKDYSLEDFKRDLEKLMLLVPAKDQNALVLGIKAEQLIRQRSLEQVFGHLKRNVRGNHRSHFKGQAEEINEDKRAYEFGDALDKIDFHSSIINAQRRMGSATGELSEEDLEVFESDHHTRLSTVLMIDISHSMILYGEDRITPAKKVAMALGEWISRYFPKDTLDVVVFGNDAWQVELSELPYLSVGPYHTNTVAGLELAIELLRKRKSVNKQIFMITDGKPTCLKLPDGKYYMNSGEPDPKIIGRTIDLALRCRKLGIKITTFMLAQEYWLQEFVREFTKTNQGSAFYSGLQGLGDFVFEDYRKSKRK